MLHLQLLSDRNDPNNSSLSVAQGPEMSAVISNYNKMAMALIHYEVLHVHAWLNAAREVPQYLNTTLLVRHENGKVQKKKFLLFILQTIIDWMCGRSVILNCCFQISVNLDPVLPEVVAEARWMIKLDVALPKVIAQMLAREEDIKALNRR